jgi:hypothetical protein
MVDKGRDRLCIEWSPQFDWEDDGENVTCSVEPNNTDFSMLRLHDELKLKILRMCVHSTKNTATSTLYLINKISSKNTLNRQF